MKLFKSIILFLFLAPTLMQSQELILLKGRITSQIKELGEVNVINLRSDSNTITDRNGSFSMFVKVGDSLQFTGLQIITKKIIIEEADLAKKLYVANVEAKVIPLEEVEVKKYPNINAVSLRILEKQPKTYTPAERKLKTAGEFHWYSPLLIPFGGMSVDGLLNAISGRTAILKKELDIERKEKLLEKIQDMFKQDYFLSNLKIPEEYLRGFWYYAVDEPKLVEALKANDKINMQFIFSDLAVKYLETIKK
ncbi:hypothetical protein [Flavobacterium sp.]